MFGDIDFVPETVNSFLKHLKERGTGYYLLGTSSLKQITELTEKEELANRYVIVGRSLSDSDKDKILTELQNGKQVL